MTQQSRDLATDLKMIRLAKGLSIYRAAKAAGISTGTLWNLENRSGTFTMDTFLALLDVYGLKMTIAEDK